MNEIKITIPIKELEKDFGTGFRKELDLLVKQRFIKSYVESIMITVDKDKAVAVQSILEFESVKEPSKGAIKPKREE